MSKKLTIYDIAKLAGVSPATVSRVIHKADYVRESTSQKVWNAFKEAGISPDAMAFKATVTFPKNKSKSLVPSILACMPSWNNPFFSDVLDGIQAYIQDFGFKLIVYTGTVDNYHIDEFLKLAASLQVSGLIVAARLSEDSLLKAAAAYPLVQCSEYNPVCQNIPYVSVDNYNISKEAVTYLATAGCKKIGFFSAHPQFQFVQSRYRAYKAALVDAGLREYPEYTLSVADFSYDRILSAARTFFKLPIPPDGIFAVSDEHAHAIVKAAQQHKIKIPDDLKVIGFDDTMYSTLSTPEITTISQPRRRLGEESARLIMNMLKMPSVTPDPVILPTEIIWRESV